MLIEFHPLANLFPLMEGAEFDALVADIKAHGQREPVVIHEDMILDGRNRYRACLSAGRDPVTKEWDQEGTAQEFVVSKNLHRRHLNESQRAMIAARLSNIARGEVGGGHEKADSQITLSGAAELLNVSRASVQEAKTVLTRGTNEEIHAVETGEAAVGTLGRQIRAMTPPQKRAKKRGEPISQTGKNPERIQRQQLHAEIWERLRETLANLTGLPLASEVATMARSNINRAGYVDARLAKSIQWLTEFSNAWNDHE